MSKNYSSAFLEVPLADELFECIQGPFQSYVTVDWRPEEEHSLGSPYRHVFYHTYSNIVIGPPDDPDVQATLRLAFEAYLRRLRESVPSTIVGKPKLFWRFRKGNHIQLEGENKRRESREKEWMSKLYTRLVVPSSSLLLCAQCLHTEGGPHAKYCENIVGRSHVEVAR